ncbi:MAG: hypothetical protein HC886_18945 [Leptolyngbyaceae cyanobacterium SM1_1_3]|nr:hypothetical protein [Leptolyngbyaceae cyanobacterium SM1_1_3]NJN02439.1 hypothetical protein [Leptolyngbyaceae cyanobacterium RM1_1_2]
MAQAAPEVSSTQLAQGLPPLPGTVVQPNRFDGETAIAAARRYIVYVNGNSPLLLNQVQQIEPEAFRRQYSGRTVIQTGAFDNLANAQAQVAALSEWGVGAEVAEVDRAPVAAVAASSSLPTPPFTGSSDPSVPLPVIAVPDDSVEFGQSPLPPPPSTGGAASFDPAVSSRGYYIAVPAARDQIAATAANITQLGIDSAQVLARTSPRGPHVAVGPFSDRSVAQQWNQYLRSYGFNARVYFDR